MLLTLQRTMRGDRYTMGTLAINGEHFCDTLEPTDRHLTVETITPESKVNGRTAIPTGRCPVSLTYSPRFDCQLPLVQSVPCFEGIRIHVGNTSKDTKGCICSTSNPQAISMAISMAVKSLNTMHHDTAASLTKCLVDNR